MTLALVMVVVLAPSPVCACSCAPADDEAYFSHADAVFTGTVVEHVAAEPWGQGGLDTFVFEVAAVHKGDVKREQGVRSHSDPTACGFGAEVGATYLIFAAKGGQGDLEVSICGGSRSETSSVELPQLKSVRPAPGESGTPETTMWWSVMVAALLMTAIAAVVMWRHHHQPNGAFSRRR